MIITSNTSDIFIGVFFRTEQSDQRDQHDGHRNQADHQDGKEDHAVHRHVPRGSGNLGIEILRIRNLLDKFDNIFIKYRNI